MNPVILLTVTTTVLYRELSLEAIHVRIHRGMSDRDNLARILDQKLLGERRVLASVELTNLPSHVGGLRILQDPGILSTQACKALGVVA